MLAARVLLGAALSAFWAMSITVASRLAPQGQIGRAVMFTSGGVSLATVAGVPAGVLLSDLLDWHAVFALAGVLTAALALVLRLVLPPVAAASATGIRVLLSTFVRPGISLGFAGHVLVVLGHFLAYTYVRVALERIPGVDAAAIVMLLSLFGAGGLLGTLTIGLIVDRWFAVLSVAAPIVIAAAIGMLIAGTASTVALGVVMVCWGFFFSSWLLIANTWVAHRMPDRLEAGGALVVTGFQGGIAFAAGVGGLLIDGVGVRNADAAGLALLLVGAVLFGVSQTIGRSGRSDR